MNMKVISRIIEQARQSPRTIVLCESDDLRIVQAALRATQEGIANIILVGQLTKIIELINDDKAINVLDKIAIIDPEYSSLVDDFSQVLWEKRKHKGMTLEAAIQEVNKPLCFANLLVDLGYAHGSVAGAVNNTADVVRSAIQVIGVSPEAKLVSSFFLMIMCQPFHQLKGGMIFSDCGLVIEPSAEELANIAIAAAHNAQALLGEEPKVAMLSFSTNGSAKHSAVDKVVHASNLIKAAMPDLAIDADVQLDAAIVADIAEKKGPNSKVKGQSNVLIFPNLEAGNIGYKLAERMAQATAIGPLLQGLAKPANDLSRGCNANDIFLVIAVTVVQSQALDNTSLEQNNQLTPIPER
ncbi:phosphate acetyltransferase [Shewanella sp. D64]|uniref:phosphate acetyltransferase n=1 Tax=unclassified Shewanella TaxID=196818 RepID=UPI0022BA237A|nr:MULTISPECIES: phosphate acetyltransferase [unclassified Shewanella]MEC4726988.1 phosphate acetyltransferase [Shewanella sp. D64]MEC4738515.1 phosphate acetyltransferase [Shewanella sp. E94]WBJ93735.1 phosphate acetyltransferase [Shewanella sp. MTB7]